MLLFVKGKWHKALPYLFMLVAALSRWPGLFPPNFSAFYGLAFCAGAFFPRQIKWWLPMGTMVATDILLNVFYYHQPVLSGYMLVKLLSFVALIALGCLFSARMPWLKLLCGGLFGAVLFYLITNTASKALFALVLVWSNSSALRNSVSARSNCPVRANERP